MVTMVTRNIFTLETDGIHRRTSAYMIVCHGYQNDFTLETDGTQWRTIMYNHGHHGHHGHQNDFTWTIAVTMVTRMILLWRQTVYIGVHDCTPWLPGCTK